MNQDSNTFSEIILFQCILKHFVRYFFFQAFRGISGHYFLQTGLKLIEALNLIIVKLKFHSFKAQRYNNFTRVNTSPKIG